MIGGLRENFHDDRDPGEVEVKVVALDVDDMGLSQTNRVHSQKSGSEKNLVAGA